MAEDSIHLASNNASNAKEATESSDDLAARLPSVARPIMALSDIAAPRCTGKAAIASRKVAHRLLWANGSGVNRLASSLSWRSQTRDRIRATHRMALAKFPDF